MAHQPVVLITGATQGIGRATAAYLAERGFTVYGTGRDPSEVEPLAGVRFLPLDVTAEGSGAQCVSMVVEAEGQLNALVNNAGYALTGPLENTTLDDLRHQFEVNLVGVHRMVRACLPYLHEAGGRIINVTSAAGHVALPFMAAYSASKFALEGYSEGLRQELSPLGVWVSIVVPGTTATDVLGHGRKTAQVSEYYTPYLQRFARAMDYSFQHADPPEEVAQAVYKALVDEPPLVRYIAHSAQRFTGMRLVLSAEEIETKLRTGMRLDG